MPATLDVNVLEDPAHACAAMLLGPILGGGNLVLTGGSTPRRAYEELARALQAADHDVSETALWFSDERCVPPDDELSNFGLVRHALLAALDPDTAPQAHRIEGELGPHEAAERYELRLSQSGAPEFDLVLLGLGPDGHIASLFPGQESLAEDSRLVVGVEQAGLEPFVPRVSLTLPALANSRQIVFLVTGEAKADAVAGAFGPDAETDPQLPASLLVARAREITLLLDDEAASKL